MTSSNSKLLSEIMNNVDNWTAQHRNTETNNHAVSGIQSHDLSVQAVNACATDRAATGTGVCVWFLSLKEVENWRLHCHLKEKYSLQITEAYTEPKCVLCYVSYTMALHIRLLPIKIYLPNEFMFYHTVRITVWQVHISKYATTFNTN